MKSFYNYLNEYLFIPDEMLVIILGIIIYFLSYEEYKEIFFVDILITTFVLVIYDLYLKKILLFDNIDEYYKLIINNVITIVVIDFLLKIIKDRFNPKLNLINYFNIAISCFLYETIIFKLYNYNNVCNNYLRSMQKTIIRLATIHILSNFLNNNPYDDEWFKFSLSQIINLSLFNSAFS